MPTVPPAIGPCCSARATVTSARNCSGTPTTRESTSPWTAGSPVMPTKHSGPFRQRVSAARRPPERVNRGRDPPRHLRRATNLIPETRCPLPERECYDPDDHGSGGDQAPRGVSFREQSRSHGGPDEDGDLTRRSHVAHGREDERRQDENVGERAQDGHPDDLGLIVAPEGHDLLPIGHRERGQQERGDYGRCPALQKGWDEERAHRLLVPDGVRRDKHAGHETVEDAGSESGPKARPFARQHEDAGRDEGYAEDDEQRWPLAEQNDGRSRREQGPGAARQRIDEREVPYRVPPLQKHEVPEMQDTAPEHEQELRGSQMRRDHEHHDGRERRVDQHRT